MNDSAEVVECCCPKYSFGNAEWDIGALKQLLDNEPEIVNSRLSTSTGDTLGHVWLASRGRLVTEVIQAIELILEAGGDVRATNGRGNSLLHYSIWYASAEVTAFLLEQDADPNTVNRWGETPLHGAVAFCKADVVRVLLDSGVDATAKDVRGWTPLDYAEAIQRGELACPRAGHCRRIDSMPDLAADLASSVQQLLGRQINETSTFETGDRRICVEM